MKVICVCFVLMSLAALCQGFSQPIIPNTRAEGCIDGVCGPHCSWDGVKLFPNNSLNQPGKCNILRCTDDFSIVITPCPFDMTAQYEWVGRDTSKSYPDCCGTKTKRNPTS